MPTTLYAGTYSGGVFKSTDGGGSWGEARTGLTHADIYALAVDPLTPTTLYAAGGGMFKSTDGGGSWHEVSTGLPNTRIHALVIDPITPTTLYAGTGGGVFKSTDGGESWHEANTGLTDTNVNALMIDPITPTFLYAGVGYWEGATSRNCVFKSTDGGGSWSAVHTGLSDTNVFALAIDPVTPTTLYAGTWYDAINKRTDGGIFKSTDGSTSWARTDLANMTVMTLVIDLATPTTLYAGTLEDGIFKSTDAGTSWIAINNGLAYSP